MLSEACDLAREHYGPTHPAGLAPLLDLQDALTASIALAESAAGAKSASTKEGSEAEELRKTRALVTGRILAILQVGGAQVDMIDIDCGWFGCCSLSCHKKVQLCAASSRHAAAGLATI